MTLVPDPDSLAAGISREYLLRHRICPLGRSPEDTLVLGATRAASQAAIREVAEVYGLPFALRELSDEELDQRVERLANQATAAISMERDADEDDERLADTRELASQPPVVRYVNLLLREASDAAASDIHLEATRAGFVARFRVDGALLPAPDPPRGLQHAIVSRIKTIAELDIAERRRPQDGRLRARLAERELDLRVSTLPTVHGESVVIRLLDRGGRPVELAELGMPIATREALTKLVARPHGLLLVTGPTGSGKTTTLYAALQRRDPSREKVITVEDPVEYELTGVTQVQVLRAAGVTFASALRAILRQDPDVVMVGEMRDRETAEIAVQAAMTGHLVLSTLHTNDALGAIPRLKDLGVPDYLIGATLEAVLAQRLVRRICDNCSAPYYVDGQVVAALTGRPATAITSQRGVGCDKCRGTGFRGRTGVFEFLAMTDALRSAISRGRPADEIERLAEAAGRRPLREHGRQLAETGVTTHEEVLRVVQE